MSESSINLLGIHFKNLQPAELPDGQWQQLWDVRQAAFGEAFSQTRTPDEISHYLGSPEDFKRLSLDPQQRVASGRGFNVQQTYKRPQLLVAYAGDLVVGFAYTADNVSGATEQIRRKKELTRVKNYRTVTEAVVAPEYQGRGIGLALGFGALRTARVGQRLTAYTFPEELPRANELAARLAIISGGHHMGTTPKPYFGETAEPVQQAAWLIRHPRREARHIMGNGLGSDEAGHRWYVMKLVKRQLFPPLSERVGSRVLDLVYDEGGLLDKLQPAIDRAEQYFDRGKR